MPADPVRVKSLFLEAVGLPTADRPAFLAAVADPAERAELARLLEAHAAPDPRPDATSPHLPPTDAHPAGDVGELIADRYKLLERIGEGGMGTVWLAEQRQPVRRTVAVKLVRAGLDSKQVLVRFEAERQALALMDHPNIARVFDGGLHAGRPYFVMELVKGVPITVFCDARRLTPRQRLELFVPVCQAIQHAHQKGVIHRDIKPSNVLVALFDDRPVPKVIDFGIAKAAGGGLTDHTLATGFGAVVGTPEYMSPEQASFNNLDIDTRSDVYGLGVLLYELLTGSTPVDRAALKQAALLEVLRVVREVEAPRPSQKLSTAAARASIAAARGTEPARLSKLLKGELDWVVLKALEKDRGRRYESAAGLARDVERYLNDEVVEARPPTVGYRVRKFVRRHKGQVLAAAALAVIAMTAVALQLRAAAAIRTALAAEMSARATANAALSAAEDRAAEQAVTLAHQEKDTSSRHEVLRLAGVLRQVPDRLTELRQHVIASTLTAGQWFAHLYKPTVLSDGSSPQQSELSPDGRWLLWCGAGEPPRVRTIGSGQTTQLGPVGGKAVLAGWADGGRTVYTDSADGVVRFWDPATGRVILQTADRPARHALTCSGWYLWSARGEAEAAISCQVSGRRVVTARRRHAWSLPDVQRLSASEMPATRICPPVELWDTTDGRLIRPLPIPASGCDRLTIVADRWVVAPAGDDTLVVFELDAGRQVARVRLPRREYIGDVFGNPAGTRLAVLCHTSSPSPVAEWQEWDATTWRETGPPLVLGSHCHGRDSRYLTDDVFSCNVLNANDWSCRLIRSGRLVRDVFRKPEPFAVAPESAESLGDDLFAFSSGQVYSARADKLIPRPPGRRFHPALARRSVNGRYWPDRSNQLVVDVLTDRLLPGMYWHGRSLCVADVGLLTVSPDGNVQIIPTKPLAVSDSCLELWAQVAVRGELGPDGEFVKWDEPTWQRKWQELAAVPPPDPAFPFPGHLARDPLHWLREEFEAAADADELPLVRELLRRSEASGDRPEANRWRRELRKLVPEVAPPPRPVVN
jgi:WD40 repeat protein